MRIEVWKNRLAYLDEMTPIWEEPGVGWSSWLWKWELRTPQEMREQARDMKHNDRQLEIQEKALKCIDKHAIVKNFP